MSDNLDWPKGITRKRNRIQLSFMYAGVRCRELMPAQTKISQQSINYAVRKLDAIKLAITENTFNYREHFPNSASALKFDDAAADDINRTVAQAVDMWLEIAGEQCATSTVDGYKTKAKHVKAYFEDKRIRNVKRIDITRFRVYLIETLEQKISTVNDTFTVLRGAFAVSKQDKIITDNVLELIPNLKEDEESESLADPYKEKQIKEIEQLRINGYSNPQAINMFLFTCWTGLSLSEAMALAWEDIDLTEMSLKVRRARVEQEYKVPKEKARSREFELLQPAIEILLDQRKHTFMQKPLEVSVRRRSNVHSETESIRLVFKNIHPECLDGAWKKKAVHAAYADILKKAKIRHRGANQCRHTFASMLITKYVPLDVIAGLMGHTSTKMLRKHYAKIIPEDRPNIAKLVSGIMGIDYAHGRDEAPTDLAK